MGTNYYLHNESSPCPTCGHREEAEPLHIGKSSGGWCFALSYNPAENLKCIEDWELYLLSAPGIIRDEYGVGISYKSLMQVIKERARHQPVDAESFPHGSMTKAEFLRDNYAEEGPNNLLRHIVSAESRCVAHGAGTWDMIEGEFS